MGNGLMLAENALMTDVTDQIPETAGYEQRPASLFAFLRYMGLRVVLVWLVLLLLAYEIHLVGTKDILTHPVDAFVARIGMMVYGSTVAVTVDLAGVRTLDALRPLVIRAGRLLGAAPDQGLLQADEVWGESILRWATTDRQGRQLRITGRVPGGARPALGPATLRLELSQWGAETKPVHRQVVAVNTTASRFGAVTDASVEVYGFVPAAAGNGPEGWLQCWQVLELDKIQVGEAVKFRGRTLDLSMSRRKPAAFKLEFAPATETGKGGRVALRVEN